MRARIPTLLAALALPCVLAGLLAGPAGAQTFSGQGASPTMVLPGTAPAPAAPRPPEPRSEPVLPLRRLPAIAAPLRLWGEAGRLAWPLYVTEAQARSGGRIRIGYMAAVSVLPDASALTVTLNGAALGAAPVAGGHGLQQVMVEVPPNRLAPGFNALGVELRQRHRVDCTVAASYELWTQIDPESTGFLPAPFSAPAPAALSELPAAALASGGALPIRIVQTGARMTERGVERALEAVQALALAARAGQPVVAFGTGAGDGVAAGEGLALAAAPVAELAGLVDPAALGPVSGPVTGPRLALVPGGPERRALVVATGTNEAEVAQAVAELARAAAAPPRGTPEGLRALADAEGRRVSGGESLTLADLGLPDMPVRGRSHRVAVDLAFPADVMPADYDRVVLDLDLLQGGDVGAGAQVVVEVNGRNAASAALGRAGGSGRRSVPLPLGRFRPGLNRIVIKAELPGPAPESCAEEPGPVRLTLRAGTRLTIPPLARILRQPDLAQTLAGALPYAGSARRPTLVVPAPDADSMAAAATLAARLGVAAGRPLPFAFAAARAVEGPAVVVGPLRALDGAAGAAAEAGRLRAAWDAPTPPRLPLPSLRRTVLRLDGVPACLARGTAAEPQGESAQGGPDGPDPGHAAALLAQAVTGPAGDDLLTVLTAPSPAQLREAAACLAHPRAWSRPEGRLATLSGADGTLASQAPPDYRFALSGPPALANLRRIAAGWLSLHVAWYGLAALALAGLLAGSTRLLVRNLGRRSP